MRNGLITQNLLTKYIKAISKSDIQYYTDPKQFCQALIYIISRGLAQSGRAPALGAGGRRFKSFIPDQYFYLTNQLYCGIISHNIKGKLNHGIQKRKT